MIRSRCITMQYDAQVAQNQTDLMLACAVMPKRGKIKSIKGHLLTKTGSNAAQLNLYKSGAAGSTSAASTTNTLASAMNMTSDAIVTGTLTTTMANRDFLAGEVLYLKATTGATTTMDVISVTIEVDY